MWGFGRPAAPAPDADPPPAAAASPSPSVKPTLTAEQVKAQRLRKLEQQVSSAKSSAAPSSTSPTSTASPTPPRQPSRPDGPPPPLSTSAKPRTSSPASAPMAVSPSDSPAALTRTPAKASASPTAATNAPSLPAAFSSLPGNLQPSAALSASAWQSELIQDVLSVSIDKHRVTPATRHRTFLAEAAKEATASAAGGERLLSLEQLDSVLIERLSLPLGQHTSRLVYLLASYKRAGEVLAALMHIQANLQSSYAASLSAPLFLTTLSDVSLAYDACEQLLSRIVAFCCMVLTDDDVEPSAHSPSGQPLMVKEVNQHELLRLLSSDPLLSRTLPPHFLDYVVKYTDPEQLADAFTPIIGQCSGTLQPTAGLSLFESSKERVLVLATLAKLPPLATLIVRHPSFIPLPPQTGRSFQLNALLGVHLSHVTSPQDPMFNDIRHKSERDLEADVARQSADFNHYHARLVELFKSLIKDADNRERVVRFFSTMLSLNAGRRKTYYDQWSTASDSLFFTSLVALLQLAQPIARKSDMQVVKLDFVISNPRIAYDGSTRLIASTADVAARKAEVREAAFNFSTDCFFLTHECLHLLQPLFRHYLEVQKSCSQMQRALRHADRSSDGFEQMQGQFDGLLTQLFALNTHLLDPAFHSDALTFLDYSCHVIHHHISQASLLVNYLPESMLECMIEYYSFLGQFCPTVFPSLSSAHFAYLPSLITTLAAGPHALKNPHLRAKLPLLIMLLFVPRPPSLSGSSAAPPSLSYMLESSPAFLQSLMPSLIDLYVEIEFGDRMFFPKFNVRYEITLILEHLYTVPHYRAALIALSKELSHFLAFTNALANDLVYLFDEGLKCLTQIKELQAERDTPAYATLPPAAREEKEREYGQVEGSCTSYLQLASSTIHLLSVLSADIVEPFTTPRLDFVTRFASTLTYYINKLVGPSVSDLKVKDKDKYHFAPRVLLKEMIVIFLHLSSSSRFLEKVASDERSYSPEIFDRAYAIMKRREILDPPDLRLFYAKKQEIALLHAHQADFQESLGDVPEHFLDALMSCMMSDPVRLPISKQVVDRVTIERHLMNSKTDPFIRVPLDVSQLEPLPELRDEIERWIAEKKAEWMAGLKKQRQEQGEGEDDDTDMKTQDDGKDDGKDEADML